MTVTDSYGYEYDNLNELELGEDGYIYANVWFTKDVLKINPASGEVVHKYDFTSLFEAENLF
jgi:glutaminyl-peptide cyclotransferase